MTDSPATDPAVSTPPDAPVSDEALATSGSDPAVGQTDSGQATAATSPHSWCWVVTGLAAALLCVVHLLVIRPILNPEVSAEYLALDTEDMSTLDERQGYERWFAETTMRNAVFIPALVVVPVFVFTAFYLTRRPANFIAGILFGLCVAFALGVLAAPPLVQAESQMVQGLGDRDFEAIAMHAGLWALIFTATWLGIWVATFEHLESFKAWLAMLGAAAIAALLYVIVAGILDPLGDVRKATAVGFVQTALWSVLPPLLAGVLMWRTCRFTRREVAAMPGAEYQSPETSEGETLRTV